MQPLINGFKKRKRNGRYHWRHLHALHATRKHPSARHIISTYKLLPRQLCRRKDSIPMEVKLKRVCVRAHAQLQAAHAFKALTSMMRRLYVCTSLGNASTARPCGCAAHAEVQLAGPWNHSGPSVLWHPDVNPRCSSPANDSVCGIRYSFK